MDFSSRQISASMFLWKPDFKHLDCAPNPQKNVCLAPEYYRNDLQIGHWPDIFFDETTVKCQKRIVRWYSLPNWYSYAKDLYISIYQICECVVHYKDSFLRDLMEFESPENLGVYFRRSLLCHFELSLFSAELQAIQIFWRVGFH